MLTAKDFIVAGFIKIGGGKGQKIFVKEIIKHPSFNFGNFLALLSMLWSSFGFNSDNDIAILKVAIHFNS